MKDTHLTLRLPIALARALAKWAAARGVPKSQVAREAVLRYLSPAPDHQAAAGGLTARELAFRWSGLPRLLPEEADALAEDLAAARSNLPLPRGPWE